MTGSKRDTVRLLECAIEQDHYCFDTDCIAGVFQSSSVHADDSASPEIAGALTYGRQEIPVFSLRTILGYESHTLQRCHVVVVRSRGMHFGVLVDLVLGSREANFDQLSPLPRIAWNADKPFFDGVAVLDQRSRRAMNADHGDGSRQLATREGLDISLLIAPQGLLGEPLDGASSRWRGTPLDLTALRYQQQNQTGQIMVFGIPEGNQELPASLALSISQVLEVVQRKQLVRVPGAPERVEGLAFWRDQIVPVVDISLALGIANSHAPSATRLVIARNCQQQL
ncbi:MAG: chemotaxis protein CheW, partial [Planctomycetales bacterium]|nr:chemotaxis protein CheW [Planctomycetales bacterium]